MSHGSLYVYMINSYLTKRELVVSTKKSNDLPGKCLKDPFYHVAR